MYFAATACLFYYCLLRVNLPAFFFKPTNFSSLDKFIHDWQKEQLVKSRESLSSSSLCASFQFSQSSPTCCSSTTQLNPYRNLPRRSRRKKHQGIDSRKEQDLNESSALEVNKQNHTQKGSQGKGRGLCARTRMYRCRRKGGKKPWNFMLLKSDKILFVRSIKMRWKFQPWMLSFLK